MEYLLMNILIMVLVLGIIFMVLRAVGLPPPWLNIAYLVIALIVVIWLLRLLGVFSYPIPRGGLL